MEFFIEELLGSFLGNFLEGWGLEEIFSPPAPGRPGRPEDYAKWEAWAEPERRPKRGTKWSQNGARMEPKRCPNRRKIDYVEWQSTQNTHIKDRGSDPLHRGDSGCDSGGRVREVRDSGIQRRRDSGIQGFRASVM